MYLGNSIIEELLFRRALGGSPSLDNDINFWYGLQVQKLQITQQAEVGKIQEHIQSGWRDWAATDWMDHLTNKVIYFEW